MEGELLEAFGWSAIRGRGRDFLFSADCTKMFFSNGGSLFFADCSKDVEDLAWTPIDTRGISETRKALSKEEELLNERKRVHASGGVSSYEYHDGTQKLILYGCGSIFLLDEALQLRHLEPAQAGPRLHASLSRDGRFLGYVRKHNLFLQDVETLKEVRVNAELAEGTIAGEADFNHQEEFDRYEAFWISPEESKDGKVQVMYIETDESGVHEYNIVESGVEGKVDNFKYPLAGYKNSTMRVFIATVDVASGEVQRRALKHPLIFSFPWMEYIPRGGWDAQGPWLQLLDRAQKKLQIVVLDPQKLEEDPVAIITEQTANLWINVGKEVGRPLHVFKDGSILIASEHTGFVHLYRSYADKDELLPITSGEWPVIVGYRNKSSTVVVNEEKNVVFFEARRDSPLEKHLYCASTDTPHNNPARVFCLTKEGFNHTTQLSPNGLMFADSFSNIATMPKTNVFRVELGEEFGEPKVALVGKLPRLKLFPEIPPSFPVHPPKFFKIHNGGYDLYGMTYFPEDYDKDSPYPTLVYTYGGPHVQLVQNDYAMTRGFRPALWQLLASKGYVVSVLDNRGSFNRGLAFEAEIRWKMGTVELDDQIAHVKYLVDKGITDPKRVAITGASYGGYMTLMAMAKHSDVFKIGYSSAPVSLWEAYDTGYTERYMGTPEENPIGYAQGSVLTHASGFPSEPNRLVVSHGLTDENVHFCHTSLLVEKLIEHGKPYELKIYPQDRHGISKPKSLIYDKAFFFRHLMKHL